LLLQLRRAARVWALDVHFRDMDLEPELPQPRDVGRNLRFVRGRAVRDFSFDVHLEPNSIDRDLAFDH